MRRKARSATPCSRRSTPRRRRPRPRSPGSSGSSARRSRREQPLVLVFDDVHWAEPTFLELVEHLAGKGEAPILVVCIAREELLEERPAFLDGLPSADYLVLDALSADETDALLDRLGGAVLESDQRDRIVATAEGNPFFLEQLLALALEGGLAERQLPETVQALLAARLDRLGPGERAVLERAAVIGKEFRLDDVAALLEPEAAPTAEAHMQALSARGFVRPRRARTRSDSATSSCRRPSTAPPRSGCARSSTSASSTASRAGTTALRSSTSSPATTSSRRIGCEPSSASPTGAPSDSPRTPGAGSATPASAHSSAATCPRRSACSSARFRCFRASKRRATSSCASSASLVMRPDSPRPAT